MADSPMVADMEVDSNEAVGSSTGTRNLEQAAQTLPQATAADNSSSSDVTSSAAASLPRVPLTNAALENTSNTDTQVTQQTNNSVIPVPVQRPPPLIQPESQGRTRELPRPASAPARRFYDPRLVPIRIRRLKTELKEMTTDPPPNCMASPKGDDLSEWVATISGPEDSVYAGGTFFMDVTFPDHYPYTAPRIRFKTKIYHCNINSHGIICLDILKERWCPALTLSKILLSITSLLCDANPEDPLVGSIARLFVSDRAEHDRNAKIWTEKYAM